MRREQTPRVAVCGWELSHNAAGRVRTLADLWRPLAETEIIGATFPRWGDALWAPIRESEIPCHMTHVAEEAAFPRQALEHVLAHPYDIVHLSKPRFPNILFGLLYKLIWDARVILDIDDEELGAVQAEVPLALETLLEQHGGEPRWEDLTRKEWTRAAVGLWDIFDGATVSNPALQARYGGPVIAHARSAAQFTPSPERRSASRERFGIPQDKTVVLFFGTPRRHKGLVETAQAVAALGRDDLCYVVAGDFPDPKLKEELAAIEGADIRFLPGQPYDDIADVVAMGDICVLLQRESSLMASYQLPAKMVDALAMGLLVLAQPTPALMDAIKAGAVAEIFPHNLTETLARWLDDPEAMRAVQACGRAWFLDQLEVERATAPLEELLSETPPLPAPDILLERPEQHRLFERLGGWQMFSAAETAVPTVPPVGGHADDPAALGPPVSSASVVNAPTVRGGLESARAHVKAKKWNSALRILSRLAGDRGAYDHDLVMELFDQSLRQAVLENQPELPDQLVEPGLEGIKALRSGRLEAALPHWQAYWRTAGESERLPEHLRFKWYENLNAQRFTENTPCIEPPATRTSQTRVVVYTALFGDYDALRAPLYSPEGVDFVCFSDRERRIPGWEVRVVQDWPDDPVLANRYFKFLPHRHFPDYNSSYYIDANILVAGDMGRLYRNWLAERPFVAWRHPDRSDVQDEVEAILTNLRAPPETMIDLATFLQDECVPDHIGMLEAALMWRRHDDPGVRALMEQWWELFQTYPSRDQPLLAYGMWKTGTRPLAMPAFLGDTRKNDFTIKLKHRQTRLETAADAADGAQNAAFATPSQAPMPSPRPRQSLTWVYWDKLRSRASTLMRGGQLSEIARARLDIPVNYVDQTEAAGVTGSILILTKSYLQKAQAADVEALRARDNLICADYVDEPPRPDLDALIDIFISSSIQQHIHFCNRYPDKPTHMITHHTDARITNVRTPQDGLRIGYFGELANARHRDDLAGQVAFNPIDTKNVRDGDDGWIRQLGQANMHYAVRTRREIDGFKPFLKGFTAAACGVNLIIPLTEGDARYYLAGC